MQSHPNYQPEIMSLFEEATDFAQRFPIDATLEAMKRLIAEEAIEVALATTVEHVLEETADVLFVTFSRYAHGIESGLFTNEDVVEALNNVIAKNAAKTPDTHTVFKNKVVRR